MRVSNIMACGGHPGDIPMSSEEAHPLSSSEDIGISPG
jgi:hypothetical protein